MTEMEKVIKELTNLPTTIYCGFYHLRITHDLRDKVIALLKEQEVVRCKDCKYFDGEGCDNINSPCKGINTYADWFCADGKHK